MVLERWYLSSKVDWVMSCFVIMNSYERPIQNPCEDAEGSVQETRRILRVIRSHTNHNVKNFMRTFDWIEPSERRQQQPLQHELHMGTLEGRWTSKRTGHGWAELGEELQAIPLSAEESEEVGQMGNGQEKDVEAFKRQDRAIRLSSLCVLRLQGPSVGV